ncbi:squalene/phytoene synthase family protein [Caldovatus aquaticus]|uniref:Squalene/phytoene synthase family protein n=1 Tax=Caldovatus aquaticus TaxID=2865671 RepID=A0ABS7F340_9PROT|nr:squalene/phytoene synthase family protein [Caldovatus aquaticus]MBW8270026.1 squalene/phytoene synthase family protein [Caldovatus aquaticus]
MAAPALSPVARLARAQDPDRFLCALFAPAERREALFALIAYNAELARVRAVAARPLAALIRLQWWRDTVAAAAAGAPPPRHEVAVPLAVAIRAGALDAADLIALADARAAEAEEVPFPTQESFHAYLRGTAGRFAIAAGRLLGAPAEALPGLEARGAAYGAAGVLRAAPALARQGWCLLPADLLAAHGLSAEAAARDPAAPGWRALARALLDSPALAPPPAGRVPAAWIAAALPAVLARRDARRLRRAGLAAARPGRGLGDRLAVTWAALRGRA